MVVQKSNIGHFNKHLYIRRYSYSGHTWPLKKKERLKLKPIVNCFKYLFRSHLLHCLHILLHLCPSKHVLGDYQRHLQRCEGGSPADQVPLDNVVDPDPLGSASN
jgi:hypothetical protein